MNPPAIMSVRVNRKSFLSDFTQQRRYTCKSMTSDLDLLGQYVRKKSQDAFAEIVRRRVDLVYSAALRQVRSPQLAEEVAQSVFTDLARNAGKISGTGVPPVSSLTPWLYAVTRRTSIDVIRKESRRQLREQIAVEMTNMNTTESSTGVPPVWSEIEPFLDEAMESLDEADRSAVLLRYFESKSLREVGEALGASEDAAQKRVSRAVERLREFFSKRNVTIGASGLAVLISANAVQAAPIRLAQGIITAFFKCNWFLGRLDIFFISSWQSAGCWRCCRGCFPWCWNLLLRSGKIFWWKISSRRQPRHFGKQQSRQFQFTPT